VSDATTWQKRTSRSENGAASRSVRRKIAPIAVLECRAGAAHHGIVGGVRDEHRLAGFERPLQLGIAVEVDDEVADRRVLVARDEAHILRVPGEVDGAAVETEGLAQLPRDGLQDVGEVQRRGDFLQNLHDRDEMIPLVLQLLDPLLQAADALGWRLELEIRGAGGRTGHRRRRYAG
jgi:hypothetical protein